MRTTLNLSLSGSYSWIHACPTVRPVLSVSVVKVHVGAAWCGHTAQQGTTGAVNLISILCEAGVLARSDPQPPQRILLGNLVAVHHLVSVGPPACTSERP